MSGIMVQSSEALNKLYDAFEDLGLVHRYSEELGEFDVKTGDTWVCFYVDPLVLQEEHDAEAWAQDAYAVADTYWRQ